MILLQLLLSFAQIGLLSFGGGYASMALIQRQVVDLHGWLTMGQFADIMAIAEMTPGPIAVNAATFVGIRVAGLPGALVATLGCVVPTCAVALLLAIIYERYHSLSIMQGALSGLRPAVVAMIASAGLSLFSMALYGERDLPSELSALAEPDPVALVIFILALVCLIALKWPPIRVMLGAGVAGVVLGLIFNGTASAEKARDIVTEADSVYHAQHIERHVGEGDGCAAYFAPGEDEPCAPIWVDADGAPLLELRARLSQP